MKRFIEDSYLISGLSFININLPLAGWEHFIPGAILFQVFGSLPIVVGRAAGIVVRPRVFIIPVVVIIRRSIPSRGITSAGIVRIIVAVTVAVTWSGV
jgi:hypothetical protein